MINVNHDTSDPCVGEPAESSERVRTNLTQRPLEVLATSATNYRPSDGTDSFSRRQFLGTTAAAGASTFAASSALAKGGGAGNKVRLGVIGAGGRGKWIAKLFRDHGGYDVAACADYFKDRVDSFGNDLNIDEKHRFTGLDSHKKLLGTNIDAVAIISPPYFHPEQAAAAVAADKHVYLAKPVAVDVPGCHSIQKSGESARKKGKAFLIDFQTRANSYFIEAIKRVHDGALGDLAFGESLYHAGRLTAQAKEGDPGARLRNWVFDKALSGDIITEQNIHTLDVMNWIMQKPPIRVSGTGGRKVRVDVGDCWDHFALTYEYENNVGITFSSRQFNGHGTPGGIINRMFGSKGVLLTEYGGTVMIRGGKGSFYRGGKTQPIYKEGAVNNIATFHKDIVEGNAANPTLETSVQSNLVTIMGRTAAYEARSVTWKELVNSTAQMAPDLSGLKA